MGVVKGWVSDFFIVIFEFCVSKLVSVSIFSSIASLFIFGGVGRGRGQGLGLRFFNCCFQLLHINISLCVNFQLDWSTFRF